MCESSLVGSKPAVLADGTIANRMLGIGGFADRVFVAAAQCVKYDPAIRAEAAALVAAGPSARLISPRLVIGAATCALASSERAP